MEVLLYFCWLIISRLFNEVETIAREAVVSESSLHLRKAKRALMLAHDTRRRKQTRQLVETDFFK